MNVREEGVEDASGWAWEYNPSAEWVVADLKPVDQERVKVLATALTDLAAVGLGPDGRLDDDSNPQRLRTYAVEMMLLWYQVIEHRKRVRHSYQSLIHSGRTRPVM